MSSKEHDPKWWNHALIYQIYPRSFMDSNNDGIGDLKGITQKLKHLADLQVNAVWLSPIFASPMVDFGYDISDYKSIHPDYGTMADFEKLMKEAAALDIKILLDLVPNHSSDECEWFKKSVLRQPGFENFYIWSDGKLDENGTRTPPNNWVSVFRGSAWTWNDKRKQYYLHQFAKEQPDLNFRNPDVLKAIDDVILFWLGKGVAGFRIDAFSHLFEDPELRDEPLSGQTTDKNSYSYTEHIYTKDLPELYGILEHWRELLDNYNLSHGGPSRIIMTESYADVKILMDYYETPNGKLGVHFPFNFIMISDLNAQSDARDFVFNLQKWLTYMPRGHIPNWVIGNHDVQRVATRYPAQLTDALNMLLLTLPGVAVTYNGEEIGMQSNMKITWNETVDPAGINAGPNKYKEASRDPARTPFQWNNSTNAGFSLANKTWLPVHENFVELNLAAQKEARISHYKVYRTVAALRREMTQLRSGRTELLVVNKAVFLVKRKVKELPAVFTVINISGKPQRVDLTDFADSYQHLKIMTASSTSLYGKEQKVLVKAVHLNPYDGLVCLLE